ncbi:hypothetical protein HOY80DRAFT_1064102 [Tuber brumale]|nr:hypothetical protein HOY80DRAFT_1064102 [Tuber brumale]
MARASGSWWHHAIAVRFTNVTIYGYIIRRAFKTTVQSHISGNHSSNSHSFNTNIANHYSTPAPPDGPETFKELIERTSWGVSQPEIDLDYLCDKYNQPEAGTGEWIFKDHRYKQSLDSEESELLWLCGGPGTRKAMLAKHVAANFLKGFTDPPGGVKLVFHFVSPEPPRNGTSADEPGSPQPNLSRQNGSLFDCCKTELGRQGDRFFTNPSSLWKVLGKAILDCPTGSVQFLTNGVDGLGDSLCEELIRRIRMLMSIRKIKIFLSSRDVSCVSNNLSKCAKINLHTNEFIGEDVKRFIRCKVNEFGEWGVGQGNRAIEALYAKSGGIFLWASFLGTSHQSLKTYAEKWYIHVHSGERSEKVLMIRNVALAWRPLALGEFGHISEFMEEAKTGQWLPFQGTTKENLFDENRRDGLPKVPRKELDLTVSWKCFQYLRRAFTDPKKSPKADDRRYHDSSQEPSSNLDHQEKSTEPPWEVARKDPQGAVTDIEIAEHKFYDDSARNWLEHQFFDTNDAIRNPWIELCGDPRMEVLAGGKAFSSFNAGSNGTNSNQSTLHLPSLLTAPDQHGNTPLHEAVISGFRGMVVPLVGKLATPEHRAHTGEINKQNHSGNTPLHLAVQFDHPDIVKFLVENHADLAIKNHHRVEEIRESENEIVEKAMEGAVDGTVEGAMAEMLGTAHISYGPATVVLRRKEPVGEPGENTAKVAVGEFGVETGDTGIEGDGAITEPL